MCGGATACPSRTQPPTRSKHEPEELPGALSTLGLYPKCKELWVALDKDNETVVGKGATAEQAFHEAQSKGSPKRR
jgi:hypothetical protein